MTFERYLKDVLLRHPNLKFKNKKDVWFWKVLTFFFPYLSKNFTVIGDIIYMPYSYEEFVADSQGKYSLRVLIHESVHLDQAKYGAWFYDLEDPIPRFLGKIRFIMSYLFWKFPVKFATARVEYEVEAMVIEFLQIGRTDWESIVNHLEGPTYFWSSNRQYIESRIKYYRERYENVIKVDKYDYIRD